MKLNLDALRRTFGIRWVEQPGGVDWGAEMRRSQWHQAIEQYRKHPYSKDKLQAVREACRKALEAEVYQ